MQCRERALPGDLTMLLKQGPRLPSHLSSGCFPTSDLCCSKKELLSNAASSREIFLMDKETPSSFDPMFTFTCASLMAVFLLYLLVFFRAFALPCEQLEAYVCLISVFPAMPHLISIRTPNMSTLIYLPRHSILGSLLCGRGCILWL